MEQGSAFPLIILRRIQIMQAAAVFTGKSILEVSVAATSGSHLFVKDLAPFKLLFPFSMYILYTKLSCH